MSDMTTKMTSNTKMSKQINMNNASREEVKVWNEMKMELKKHSGYHVRKQYYPYKINEWEAEHARIESEYRQKIAAMQEVRMEIETKEMLSAKRQQEYEVRMMAAEALIKLSTATPKRKANQPKPNQPLRRSTRIARNNIVDLTM